jgi:transcriptional regulator with XRE-family HTH domain
VVVGYRGKLREREQARALRAQAWTLADIAARLGVSKSSVSLWVRDVDVSPRPRRSARSLGPNRLERAKLAEIAGLRDAGQKRIGRLDDRDLLIAGVALYAGEGAKNDGRVGFANTNPQMLHLFCLWLRRFFEPDEKRLRVTVYLHEGLNLQAAETYWADVTGIPLSQFNKPYRATVRPETLRTAKHPKGCATVTYSCSRTHRAIMGLVEALLSADARAPGAAASACGP